jgi:tetratricopeptide (TPR) repeat protein
LPLNLRILLLAPWPLLAQSGGGYIGAAACAKCHASISHEWSGSLHRRMLQPATKSAIEGDFTAGKVVAGESTYLLAVRAGRYYLTESDLAGKPWEHRVDYVLGARRIQEYLTTLDDGRIIVLPAAWDNVRKQWIRQADADNPEELSDMPGQSWNKTCYPCHVSQGKKGFDLESLRYRTTWQDAGVNCESCHGPGAGHAAKGSGPITNPAPLTADRSTMVCAPCHSLRDIYADGFTPGADFYDFYLSVMEYRLPASDDPAYWPDGRPRLLANEAVGFWQSRCFLKGGATCATCHSQPHSLEPRETSAVCAACHKAIAADVSAHSHHAPHSAGNACVDCHMPAIVGGLRTRMRDHSMSVPSPEATVAFAIPNACNLCHRDRDAAWSEQQVTAWYGARPHAAMLRAAAFTEARQTDRAAVPKLLALLGDASQGGWIRANAAGYLGRFLDDPSSYDALRRAFADADPLVRATAASAIQPRAAQREALAPEMIALLRDPYRTVRMTAGIALVAMGVKPFPGEDGARFEQAKDLYRARAALNADDAQQQFAAGRFLYLADDLGGAASAFRAALRLDPTTPAKYPLARALAAQGDFAAARQVLATIARDDPQYAAAQQLRAEVESKTPGQGEAQKRFLEGQVQYRQQYYAAALQAFEQALALDAKADWAAAARIDRAICLEKLARPTEAEQAMRALADDPAARRDADLQLAFTELLLDTGRAEEALQRVEALLALAPDDPTAHFWRARVLLQLRRTAEAAAAAEESVRLQPQLPQAHNLLVRIYQMQGRTKEAAQQAEWLRDYQRRSER